MAKSKKFDPNKVGRWAGQDTFPDRIYVPAPDYDQLLEMYTKFKIARPIEEWHEDLGPCLWWVFPISEPPYSGDPLCNDWPGYHTHFTRLTNDMLPENGQDTLLEKKEGDDESSNR